MQDHTTELKQGLIVPSLQECRSLMWVSIWAANDSISTQH